MKVYCVIISSGEQHFIHSDVAVFETKQQALNYIEMLYQEYSNVDTTDDYEYESGDEFFTLIDEAADCWYDVSLVERTVK